MNEAFKKQLLSSHEYFKPKRWEGKPWRYRLKYFVANYPELAVSSFLFTFVIPAICLYKYCNYDGSRRDAIKKYRPLYTVVRDDHPNIEEIKIEKELGRKYFPEY